MGRRPASRSRTSNPSYRFKSNALSRKKLTELKQHNKDMLEFSKIERKEQSKIEQINFLKMNKIAEITKGITKSLDAEFNRNVPF